MPWAPAAPGVYIEEVSSRAHLIEGVPTDVAAFIGRAALGPLNQPVLLQSPSEFEARFGGLHVDCTMPYAVRDFFQNGGSKALVVRVAHADARAATISLPCGGHRCASLVLQARSVGAWGLGLSAAVEYEGRAVPAVPSPSAPAASRRRAQHFDLHLRWQGKGGELVQEVFRNVSVQPDDDRCLAQVLARESLLVEVRGPMPAHRPASTARVEGGTSGLHWVRADSASGSDGAVLDAADLLGDAVAGTGLHALDRPDVAFNLLCIPPLARDANVVPSDYVPPPQGVIDAAFALCVRRRAFLIVDPDPRWAASASRAVDRAVDGSAALRQAGSAGRNAALYFPCLRLPDPLREDRVDTFVPCGAVAGVIARTDATRGVWKAPAGMEAELVGVQDLQVQLGDSASERLNPLGINCLRVLGAGQRLVWGARTLRGADELADEYKYVPVRRLALFIEQSIESGIRWAVFEPNDEPLWATLRLSVGNFLGGLFRKGAFAGSTEDEAFFVRCDATTITPADQSLGLANVVVGFAPLKPAEFVIVRVVVRAGRADDPRP
ncbi:phage tail sheath subtilisin-like domain-containing protein [Variovorax dokdonensis]|uniref:Phage tail sheath subtilisin-like domain-containing protein n=1 Tax=Variovorax dokdonensis TaxID=344883 RepID=A0ABT7NCT7_9BURK|nr:phage tail sheath subtilisin-like domain-containing protein [Variovorax dokdonensis]MDM0045747.1 phage tail sheath subtilisin-like domain-containing protein [Variovorax dokdonensis]